MNLFYIQCSILYYSVILFLTCLLLSLRISKKKMDYELQFAGWQPVRHQFTSTSSYTNDARITKPIYCYLYAYGWWQRI